MASKYRFPPLENDARFEELCKDILDVISLNSEGSALFGRKGQYQYGIDIFQRNLKNQTYTVAQCKAYFNVSTTGFVNAIKDDLEKAKELPIHPVSKFIAMTTLLRDRETQNQVESLKKEKQCDYEVVCKFWNDIETVLEDNPPLMRKYYPAYSSQVSVSDCTAEYRQIWKEPMFLHENDFHNEKVTLEELYDIDQIPHYRRIGNTGTNLNEIIESFKGAILLLGDPGIGKSTFITWLLNNNKTGRKITVYRFADLKFQNYTEFEKRKWLEEIIKGLYYREEAENQTEKALRFALRQNENMLLVFDGFDETELSDAKKHEFLIEINKYARELGISILLTCRENYISDITLRDSRIPSYHLLPWDGEQIHRFARNYQKCSETIVNEETVLTAVNYKMDGNEENIFGIPLILYMVLAMKIPLKQPGSHVDVYEKIFDLENGIYDYCVGNQRYKIDGTGMKKEGKIKLHNLSRNIARWIFEHRADDAIVPSEAFEQIPYLSEEVKKEKISYSYFRKIKNVQGKGSDGLAFVHKSMYEYFLVEGFCRRADEIISRKDTENTLSFLLSDYFKNTKISKTIDIFLRRMWERMYGKRTAEEKLRIYLELEKAAADIIVNGVAYSAGVERQKYREESEMQAIGFINITHILAILKEQLSYPYRILEKQYAKFELGEENALRDALQYCVFHLYEARAEENCRLESLFMKTCELEKIHLERADLHNVDLTEAHLDNAYLMRTDLTDAILRQANLTRANLVDAKLMKAHLNDARLDYAIMRNADLTESILDRAQLDSTDMEQINLRKASLKNAYLVMANLTEADLDEADLTDAYLDQACLKNASLDRVVISLRQAQNYGELFEDAVFYSVFIKEHPYSDPKEYSEKEFRQKYVKKYT